MRPSARIVISAALAATLTCALVPAAAFGAPKASGSTATEQASTEATEDTTQKETDKETEKAKEPVTIVSAKLPYRVKTGSKWGDVVEKGKVAGNKKKPATGIQLKKIEVVKSNGKEKKWLSYTLQVYTDGSWKTVKANKKFTSGGELIQAIKLNLKNSIADVYDVYYRAYCRNFGWLDWAKNGKAAGTTRQGLSLRAIQIKLVKKKGGKKPKTSDSMTAFVKKPNVKYAVSKVSNSALKGTKKNGATAGKAKYTGKLDKIKLWLTSTKLSGKIKYRVRTGSDDDSGWTSWKANGKACGKKNRTIQAVRIKLTGQMAKYYDVFYRVYCGDHHWLGWASNGETTGTGGIGYPVGALQVVLAPKDDGAPGSTYNTYRTSGVGLSGSQLKMMRKAQNYYSGTDYLILVNRSACKLAVFSGDHDGWTLQKYWSCCVGKPSTPTVSGEFSSGYKQYSFGEKKGYSCYYATQVYEDYLIHSILYYPHTRNVMDATMGAQVSHGCIRLYIDNAKWVYDNIGYGTKVVIY